MGRHESWAGEGPDTAHRMLPSVTLPQGRAGPTLDTCGYDSSPCHRVPPVSCTRVPVPALGLLNHGCPRTEHRDTSCSGHGSAGFPRGAGASRGISVPQFPILTPGGSSLLAMMLAWALGGRSPRSRGWSTTKIELYFRTSAIRAGSIGPGAETVSAAAATAATACSGAGAPVGPGTHVSVPGHTPAGMSLCHAAQHCPGAMAGGSEPSPSPSLGCEGALGTGRQPCLLSHSQVGGMRPELEPWWPAGNGGDTDSTGSVIGSSMGSG